VKTSQKPAYQRWRQRRNWAAAHGCKWSAARSLASNISEFRRHVVSLGLDPDTLGEFARSFGATPGQRERCGGAALPPRHERSER